MIDRVQRLRLFTVTLAWNPNNAEEGDYSASIWAADRDAAIRAIAEEMADHHTDGLKDNNEQRRAQYIDNLVRAAGTYAALDVGAGLLSTASELLAGPTGQMNDEAVKDYAAVKAILARYGAVAC